MSRCTSRLAILVVLAAVAAPRIAWTQCGQQKLIGPAVVGARFGASVAVGANVIAVGAPGIDSVFVFTWNGTSWVSAGPPLTGSPNSGYGTSVCISGPWLLVGAPLKDLGPLADAGIVDVWNAATPGAYVHHSTFADGTVLAGAQFGFDVDFDGTTCVVGAPFWGGATGRVTRFAQDANGQFVFQQFMGHSASFPPSAGDQFGRSVAVDGATMAVGAPFDDMGNGKIDNGSLHFYRRIGSTWLYTQSNYFTDAFALGHGWSVDCDDDHVIAGRPSLPGAASNAVSGVSYYTWTGSTYAVAGVTNTASAAQPGYAVCIDGNRFAFTGPGASAFAFQPASQPSSGDFFLRRAEGGDFENGVKSSGEVASFADPHAELGTSCAIEGNWLAVGAERDDTAATDAGAAFVYDATLLAYRNGFTAHGSVGIASGLFGMPQIDSYGSACGGEPLVLRVSSAKPLAPMLVIAGLNFLNVPFHSGTLGPSLDLIMPVLMSSPAGVLELPALMPGGVPADTRIFLQVLVSDPAAPQGVAASVTRYFITPS